MMIKIASEADNSIGMMESARRLEALECKCKVVAEELGATVIEKEDKFIIEGEFGGWVRYFICKKNINLNSRKDTIVHYIRYEASGLEYVDMIVGEISIASILEKGGYGDLKDLNVRCYDLNKWMDVHDLCRIEVPKDLAVYSMEDVDICPLEEFESDKLFTLMTHVDLLMEWYDFRNTEKRVKGIIAEVNGADDDLPF